MCNYMETEFISENVDTKVLFLKTEEDEASSLCPIQCNVNHVQLEQCGVKHASKFHKIGSIISCDFHNYHS